LVQALASLGLGLLKRAQAGYNVKGPDLLAETQAFDLGELAAAQSVPRSPVSHAPRVI
jgi:hypothetical protein